jgi:hypothetical protein
MVRLYYEAEVRKSRSVFVGIVVFVFVFALVYGVGKLKGSSSGVVIKDYGVVGPNQEMVFKQTIRNSSSEPVVLEGFDKACGVKAYVEGNGVIAPGSSATLTLDARTNVLAGPGGATFDLTLNRNGQKTVRPYVISWIVAPHPSLSDAELWFVAGDTTAKKVSLMNSSGDEKATRLSVPKGYRAEVKGQDIYVTPVLTERSSGKATLSITLNSDDGNVVLELPLNRLESTGPVLRPDYLFILAGKSTSVRLLQPERNWRISSHDQDLSATVLKDELRVRCSSSCKEHEGKIEMSDDTGNRVVVPVYMGENL